MQKNVSHLFSWARQPVSTTILGPLKLIEAQFVHELTETIPRLVE